MPFADLRSKTGCLKCKARRKKCDEKHPRCTACARWNFPCLYPNTSAKGEDIKPLTRDHRPRLIATETHTELAAKERRPGEDEQPEPSPPGLSAAFRDGPRWTSEERQAFDFFRSHTSNDLSGVFRVRGEMDIWSRMLLQGAHQDPAIRHSICALGAFHQYLWDESVRHDSRRVLLLATQQYNKAINCTVHSTRQEHVSVDAVLTMCILFTLLERLLGDIETAMSHLRAGMKLLAGLAQQSTQSSLEATYVPRATIIVLLKRLERQMYEQGQNHRDWVSARTPLFSIDIPVEFTCLEDASAIFERYLSEALHLMHACEWRDEGQYQAQKPVEADLVSLLRRILAKWTGAFLSFLQNARLKDARMSEADQLMVHTLQLHRCVLVTSLAHYQTGDEMICDKFVAEYREAVIHGTAVVRAQRRKSELENSRGHAGGVKAPPWESHASSVPVLSSRCPSVPSDPLPPGTSQHIHIDRPSKPVLTFSTLSPMPALFTIAFRCREPYIRRHAVQLLKEIDWCDAFWDSKFTSKLAERLVQIEEYGYLGGPSSLGYNKLVERAEDVLADVRCRQLRVQFKDSQTYVCDFLRINANDWVPGPGHWERGVSDSFCELGWIREQWSLVS